METNGKLTYTDIQKNFEMHIGFQGFEYFKNTRKEINAINKFMLDEVTPEQIMELIGKLIAIKKHPQLSKTPFWQGCAINLSDLYNYQAKIEHVYANIAPKEETSNEPQTENEPATQHNEEKKKTWQEVGDRKTWKDFLHWCEDKLSESGFERMNNLSGRITREKIIIEGGLDKHDRLLIQTYFNKPVEVMELVG